MFLIIIATILTLCIIAEYIIFQRHIKHQSKGLRTTYYTLTGICVLPYILLFIIGRIWDTFSPITTAIDGVSIILLLLNATWKILYSLGIVIDGPKKHKWGTMVATILASIITLAIFYGAFWERHQLRTTEVELAFENLPDGADGMRIVQIGDLHIGLRSRKHTLLGKMAQEIERLAPDVVIDCGDMVNSRYHEVDSLSMEILSRIKAPLGVYTTLGNHDRGDYVLDTISLPKEENVRVLMERQRAMGWRNIADSTVVLRRGGDSLYLTAIRYPDHLKKGSHGVSIDEDYTHYFSPLPTDAFNIVIAHTPVMWENILSDTDAELTLSGHVHAMQLKLPIGERGWSPSALVYDHWSGLYRKENAALNITDGIGSNIPLRIGAKPEIVVITLKKCRNSQF